jgi:hypothetical protein
MIYIILLCKFLKLRILKGSVKPIFIRFGPNTWMKMLEILPGVIPAQAGIQKNGTQETGFLPSQE